MVKNYTLAVRGKPSGIVDVVVDKKQFRKKWIDSSLENDLKKSQLECAMLKLQLKEQAQQLISLEIGRNHQTWNRDAANKICSQRLPRIPR